MFRGVLAETVFGMSLSVALTGFLIGTVVSVLGLVGWYGVETWIMRVVDKELETSLWDWEFLVLLSESDVDDPWPGGWVMININGKAAGRWL